MKLVVALSFLVSLFLAGCSSSEVKPDETVAEVPLETLAPPPAETVKEPELVRPEKSAVAKKAKKKKTAAIKSAR